MCVYTWAGYMLWNSAAFSKLTSHHYCLNRVANPCVTPAPFWSNSRKRIAQVIQLICLRAHGRKYHPSTLPLKLANIASFGQRAKPLVLERGQRRKDGCSNLVPVFHHLLQSDGRSSRGHVYMWLGVRVTSPCNPQRVCSVAYRANCTCVLISHYWKTALTA